MHGLRERSRSALSLSKNATHKAPPMPRSLPEWIGKTPDTKVPDRVRLRVFSAFDGVCQLTGIKIRPGDAWECDHITPLIQGGENRESNLQPALVKAHRRKTAGEVAQKAKDARVKKKHIGVYQSKNPLRGGRGDKWKRRIDGTAVLRSEE